jgi:hypothetical protein
VTTNPLHPLHPDTVCPVRVDPSGQAGPTRKQARGPRYRRSSNGLVVPASVDADVPEQRICEAAARLPAYGGVTGWGGLRWGGATDLDGTGADGKQRPVVLAVMHGEIRPQPGIIITSERLPPGDLTTWDGISITTHVRSVCFEMRYAKNDREAIVILDMAMRDDLVDLAEVAAYVATLNGWIGVGRCRVALVLADENSWSPMETEMRLIWVVDLDFPHPLCNRPVFDLDGRHIGTPDILDVEAGVVGEYEGPLHLQGKRRGNDLQKEAAYRRIGLEYFAMVATDRRSPEATIIPRMTEARRRARWEAESARQWTVEPPHWWTRTDTVAARRALSGRQRQRLLRYRAG